MNRHFDFLFTDQSEEFFQKFAMADVGIPATIPAPVAMTKTASAKTGFEKMASRLDRDLGILKTAGQCGTGFGMCKRADAYIRVLLSNVNLTPAEFGEVFDKVAGEAIDTDLNESWVELSAECPEELHPWLEHELTKLARGMVQDAMMEKEAIVFGLLARGGAKLLSGVSKVRAGAAGVKAVVKSIPGRGVASVSSVRGALGAKGASSQMKNIQSRISAIKGTGVYQRAARKNLQAQFAKQHARKGRALRRQSAADEKLRSYGDKGFTLKPAERKFIGLKGPKSAQPGAPAGTTMAGKPPPKLDDIAAAKQKQTAATAEKAQAELRVLQGGKGKGKGTGTDGPAPKSAPKPDSTKTTDLPASAPDAVKADPKLGESWKKMTAGKPLTPEERGGLISAGIKAAIGYRLLTGKGAVTGGEGVI